MPENCITDEQILAASLTREAKIVILTGAGVSAESGIPTFRDAQSGLWSQYDPMELASPSGFKKNPQLVFDWYAWRRNTILHAQPNKAHQILANWGHLFPHLTLITQNVDGLHQVAGSPSVIEMHGSIHRLRCTNKRHPSPWVDRCESVPRCQKCNAYLRPDIVWFGEAIEKDTNRIMQHAIAQCDIFMAIGTSGQVYPAAGFLGLAKNNGALTAVINTEPFQPGTADMQFEGTASFVLGGIDESVSPVV